MSLEPVWEGTNHRSKRSVCGSKDVICVLIQATQRFPPWDFQFCEPMNPLSTYTYAIQAIPKLCVSGYTSVEIYGL